MRWLDEYIMAWIQIKNNQMKGYLNTHKEVSK